jgi:pyruvate kinase
LDVGSRVFLSDGLIELRVTRKSADNAELLCDIANGGSIGSHQGVNLPGAEIDLPAVSARDTRDLRFGVAHDVDVVFASFVRRAEHIADIRRVLGADGAHIKVIAKIENQEGVANFDEILAAADGIMVARGDLGIEVPIEKVFVHQQVMVMKCNLVGKPVIVATQMLESMIENPRPTRAEVSDVAHSIKSGASAVMLSGETAKGKYPLDSFRVMARVACEAERATDCNEAQSFALSAIERPAGTSEACAASCVRTAFLQHSSAIVIVTETGRCAQLASRFKPSCPVISVTCSKRIAKSSALLRGVFPLLVTRDEFQSAKALLRRGIEYGKQIGVVEQGDSIVALHDSDIHDAKESANTMRIMTA